MKIFTLVSQQRYLFLLILFCCLSGKIQSQTLAFPGADGFGRYAQGARASVTREVYIVTNLNDSGTGSFRDAVSKSGRIVVFSVGGIIKLVTDVSVASNVTIAGQTAPGDGIVIANKRVTFTSSNNTIARYLRVRLGATGNSGKDVSGLASGANMIFDHMSFLWAMDEVFSINYDGKGTSIDNITLQNCIIGQGLHRENHSAGGLIQTPDGGKISLLKNLYISNKTRNPKVKGVNEFVNNVVYNWGNGNRLGDQMNYGWSGEGYIMGGSSGVSEVNIINNYFMSGPLTPPDEKSPFSRGTGSFHLYGSGNIFDHNKNGIIDGTQVPYDSTAIGYPGITASSFKTQPYPYPAANTALTAAQAYQYVIDNAGATYPRRDELDAFLIDEVQSKGIKGFYVYRETDLPLSNGGLGNVFGATAPLDTDGDGMPDAWEDANGLDKNSKADAVAINGNYLNIEIYINQLVTNQSTSFLRPPSNLLASAITPNSLNLSWTDNSDSETNFILERSINATNYQVIDTLNANITTFSDSGLESNKTYYYRIKGITATETSEYASLITKTTTAPSAPAVPSSPSPANGATGIDIVNRNLTWTGSVNTTSYEVYFGTDTSNLSLKGTVTTGSYSITGLAENTTYFWRINAINNLGTTIGDVWSFKTLKNYPPAIIGDWHFDETIGTVAADSSSYANHAEVSDVPDYAWEVGKINNGINLKTMTMASGVLVPHEDHLLLDKNSFTFSLWVKGPVQSAVSKYLFHKGTFAKNIATGATGKWFGIELKDGNLVFAVDDDVTKSSATTSNSSFFNNNWNHLVVVRDVAAKKLRVYNNGSLMVETADNTVGGIGGTEPLVIANTNSFNAPFTGMLDEFKAFNYVLSENEILGLYHTGPLPLKAFAPNPVNNTTLITPTQANVSWKGGINTSTYKVYLGTDSENLIYRGEVAVNAPSYQFIGLNSGATYFWRIDAAGPAGTVTGDVWSFKTPFPLGVVADWKLDATSGSAVSDSSPYQMNGTLENITDYVWEAGKINNGLNLRTVNPNSVIRVPYKDNIAFDKNSFTISMWVKGAQPATPTVSAYLFHKGTFTKNVTTGATGKWFGVELKSGNITWNVDDDVTKSSTSGITSSTFLNNTWVHVVFVRDVAAKKLRIYRNGTLAVESNDNTVNGIGGIEPLNIANTQELNSPFKGALDDIKMFNYALTAVDISGLAATKSTQTITFNAIEPKKVADDDFDAGATSTSTLPVSYTSSNTNVATIVNGKVHVVTAGSSTITASQAGSASYIAAAPVAQVLLVSKRDQSIIFNEIAQKTIGDEDFDAGAQSGSGLSISYTSSDITIASIENGLIKIHAAGSVVIIASQAGNNVYNPAASVSQTLVISKKTQTIAFEPLSPKTIGDEDFAVGATASSGLLVSYSSSDTTVATIVDGKIHIASAGTSVITASQNGNTTYLPADPASQIIRINKKSQSITFAAITEKTIGDANFDAGATSTSGLPVSYSSSDTNVISIVNGQIHIVGAGIASVTAYQNGDNYYSEATAVSQLITVKKRDQSITFNPLAQMRIGDADILLTASASSGLPITYQSNNENVATIIDGKIHIVGAGSAVITASQIGDDTFNPSSKTQLLVVFPYNIKVFYQDGDNGQLSNNSIKPFLKLVNQDSVSVAFNQLTARYWITPENFAGINTWIDYAQIGNNKVTMKYVSLEQPLNGALGYIEYGFTPASGILSSGGNSGVIQTRFSNKDYAVFNEADDYSYQQGNSYAANTHITLYRNGSLIWGTEPTVAASIVKLKVLYENKNNNTGSNSISSTLVIVNEGNLPVEYQDLSVRYWFTSEGTSPLNYWIDYAKLGNSKFTGQFISPTALVGADTYFELKAKSELGLLYPLSNTGNIQYRIAKNNWSAFNEANDHSYKPKASLAENNRITIYHKGQLVYGLEPAAIGMIASVQDNGVFAFNQPAFSAAAPEGIETYPNPSQGNFNLIVNTSQNGKITISVYNTAGVLIQSINDIKNGSFQKEIKLQGLPTGTYIVRVNVNSFVQAKTVIIN